MGQHKFKSQREDVRGEDPQDVLADEAPRRGMAGSIVMILVIIALLASWWYGFGKSYAALKTAVVSAKSGVASVLHLGSASAPDVVVGDTLSTGDAGSVSSSADQGSASSWEIRKSIAGDSVWKVYAQEAQGGGDAALQVEVINGLKNITVLKNNISQDSLTHDSMVQGREYSFLNKDVQAKFAGKVAEASKKLQEGAHFNDLDSGLQLAYQLANAPSYQFVYSLQLSDVQQLLE